MTVYRTETGKWRFDFMAQGRRWTAAGYATKRDALAAQEDKRREVQRNPTASIFTFKELAKAFLSMSARTKSPAWTYQLTKKLDKACGHLGPVALTDLRPEHFEDVIATLHRSGNNRARSLNEYRKIMHAVMEFGVKLEAVHRNPVKKIDRQPEDAVPVEAIELAVLNKLILAADVVLAALLTFMSQTGARWVECARLVWPKVFLDGAAGPFCLLTTKKNRRRESRERPQPLNGLALRSIERMRGLDPTFVFPAGDGGAMEYRTVLKRMHELCDRIEVGRVSFHQVRHWTGMAVTANGRSTKAVAKYLGQENTGATERYQHVLDEHMWAMAREVERAGVVEALGSCVTDVGNASMPRPTKAGELT